MREKGRKGKDGKKRKKGREGGREGEENTKLCPLEIYVEILTPNVTIFGHRAFKEVIRLNKVI